jgi:hypothetical protein
MTDVPSRNEKKIMLMTVLTVLEWPNDASSYVIYTFLNSMFSSLNTGLHS